MLEGLGSERESGVCVVREFGEAERLESHPEGIRTVRALDRRGIEQQEGTRRGCQGKLFWEGFEGVIGKMWESPVNGRHIGRTRGGGGERL